MRPRRFFGGWWLPSIACFGCAYSLTMLHWWLYNTMGDAASAVQSFHAILQHGLNARNSLEGVPVFGVHLWFLPLVALPLFALVPAYPALAAAQAFVLALSVPAARRLALSMGFSAGRARTWTWIWALHPLIIGPHCGLGEGYQPTIFAITPLLWSLVMAREARWKSFFVCLLLAISCREEIAFTALGIGIWIRFVLAERKKGAVAITVSTVWIAASALLLHHTAIGQGGFTAKSLSALQFSSRSSSWTTFLRIPFFCYLGFIDLAWGGFTRKSAPHLVATLPLLAVLFLVANWGTSNPFYHYVASLSPVYFHAALVESGPDGHFGKRCQLGYLLALVLFFLWQGRLLYYGLRGADRRSMACLESKIPRDRSLKFFTPRGSAHFAWGQDMTWMGPTDRLSEYTLVETGRKLLGNWTNPDELARMEARLDSAGARVVYRTPSVHLWSLRDHKAVECP